MGRTAHATVFYGYCWHDEDDDGGVTEMFSEESWEAVLARKRGHVSPYDDYPSSTDYDLAREWRAAHRSEIDAWHAATEAMSKVYAVLLDSHGFGCVAPHLLAFGSERNAEWSEGCELTELTVDPAWRVALDGWLAEFGIEPPQSEPRWWLVASYG